MNKDLLDSAYYSHLATVIVIFVFLAIFPAVSADGYVGGTPLSTIRSGVVSGGLYVDAEPPAWGPSDVTRTFTQLPEGVDIEWARLYVAVYAGHMKNNYAGTATIFFDGDGDGTFETEIGNESLDTPGGYTYPGEGGSGTIAVNDHCTRVTSDYLMWYDVSQVISSRTPSARVVTQKVDASFDGRVKMLTLVVAYNDRDTDQVYYWINQGHDVDSYYADDHGMPYTGVTPFNLSGLSGTVQSATLTVNHLASTDGFYTWCGDPLPADPSASTVPPGWNVQGAYAGYNSWDVTDLIEPGAINDLTYDRVGQFYKLPLAILSVSLAPTPSPDLEITLVNPVTGNVFAREPNTVRVTIRNNGPGSSGQTTVRVLSSDGFEGYSTVPPIAAGQSITVPVVDTTIRNTAGEMVTYTATVDPDNLFIETNEGNNAKTSTTKTVIYNGYKGARYWTGKNDIVTARTFDLHGGILHSSGNSAYKPGGIGGASWNDYTVTWTTGDLALPPGATVKEARLFVPYTWDNSNEVPDQFRITFNGNVIPYETWYNDKSNFGGYANYVYGLLAYNVTDYFSTGGNTAIVHKDNAGSNLAVYGLTLAVVYEKAGEPRRQIFLNEGFDILGADDTGYATTPEEATAYLPFSGMVLAPGDATHAYLTTFVPAGNGPEGDLLWNGATVATNVWDYGSSSGTQVAVDTRDVKSSLLVDGNEAGIRSTAGSTPLLAASHAFLVVEYQDDAIHADFSANLTAGPAPLVVQFTDNSTGIITSYAWDLDGNGIIDSREQNPVWTYTTPGTYTVNLTVTGPGGTDTMEKQGYISVTGTPLPDLVITGISTNGNELFASEPNAISATVLNNGTGAAGPFSVRFNVSGALYTASLPGLAAGANGTATITDTILRTAGDTVMITAEADPDGDIPEIDRTNNGADLTRVVANNGYKGKRYTGGSDIGTVATFEGRINLAVSTGDSAYRSTGWTGSATNWTVSDLHIPENATILHARLYQGYTFDQTPGGKPSWTARFNDETITPDVTYTDRKGYGTYNYPSGVFVYNVTPFFSKSGNHLVVTGEEGNSNGLYGSLLLVVYADEREPQRKVLINEECDLLYAGTSRFVSDEEATSYIPFQGASGDGLQEARVIAFLYSANEAGKSAFIFNGNSHGDLSGGFEAGSQVTLKEFNVTGDMAGGDNTALYRSVMVSGSGDNMVAAGAVLVLGYAEEPPAADFSASPLTGTAPLSVQFTDLSTGNITARTWQYRSGNGTWTQFSTESNPAFSFSDPGTYDIRLTVSGPGGDNIKERTGYITVLSQPGPAADFSASPLTGTAPLSVQFTDLSTGPVTLRMWDFQNDGQVDSLAKNPTYVYRKPGVYSVRLRVRGPDGTTEKVREAYITVTAPEKPPVARFTLSPRSGIVPLTVRFTDLSTGNVTSYLWNFGDGTTSTEANPTHTYTRAGFYRVNLRVSNSAGSASVPSVVFAIPSFRLPW